MKSKLLKMLTISLALSLILGLMGSFAFAAKKELTPYEFRHQLTDEEKVKYKTIIVRWCGYPHDNWTVKETIEKFQQTLHNGDPWIGMGWYSKTLFELAHPKVKVEQVAGNVWNSQFILTGLAGGTAPACYPMHKVAKTNVGNARMALEKGLVADITDLVKDWKYTPWLKEHWGPEWERTCWKDGRCYGLPGTYPIVPGWGFEYRRDWFKEAGLFNKKGEPAPIDDWTWSEFKEIAKKLTDPKKKRWGFSLAPGAIDGIPLYPALMFGFGVPQALRPLVMPSKEGKYTWEYGATPQAIEALKFLKDMMWKDKSVLSGVEYTSLAMPHSKEMLGGRAGMVWTGNQVGNNVGNFTFDPKKSNPKFIGVAPIPRGKGNLRLRIVDFCPFGFDPTLDKEHLKASFDYYEWVAAGKGAELRFMDNIDEVKIMGPQYMGGWDIGCYMYWAYPIPEYYRSQIKVSDYVPDDYIRVTTTIAYETPGEPKSQQYGLINCEKEGLLVDVDRGVLQAIVCNPDVDIQAEVKKAADKGNKMYLNYKIKNDKEKLQKFYAAVDDFYKEYYPDWYNSTEYKEMMEKYYKVW